MQNPTDPPADIFCRNLFSSTQRTHQLNFSVHTCFWSPTDPPDPPADIFCRHLLSSPKRTHQLNFSVHNCFWNSTDPPHRSIFFSNTCFLAYNGSTSLISARRLSFTGPQNGNSSSLKSKCLGRTLCGIWD